MLYSHYSLINKKDWPFKYFMPKEIASKGDGSIFVHIESLTRLDILRELMGNPLFITSAYRDPIHNERVGGVPFSTHTQGRAFDISIRNLDKYELDINAKKVGFSGFGYYRTFLHVDTGHARWWGDRW